MELVFLEAKMPLTKTFSLKNNVLEKSQYPLIKNFKSHREQCKDLKDFHALITKHAAAGNCLLKGKLHRDLDWESRANSTLSEDTTEWMVFDLDNVQGFSTPDDFMKSIEGMEDVSYVAQYSASYKIDPKKTGLSCHIFFMCDDIVASAAKNWLYKLNFDNPVLSGQVTLTASDVSLSFPLDPTVAQNDKLIYIGNPVCVGFADPMPNRIQLVKKSTNVFSIPVLQINADQVTKERNHLVNSLRAQKGLAQRRSWALKSIGNTSYVPNPTAMTVTGTKAERGFVYLNFNHGDSWAYYHPEGDPRTIHSFKGDGPYLTKEVAPEYWAEIANAVEIAPTGGLIYLAYRHFQSSQYYNVIYNTVTHEIKRARATNLTQLQHFMEQYDRPWSGAPTDWEHVYEANVQSLDGFSRIDGDRKTINMYTPPDALKAYDPAKEYVLPESIWRVMLHACGGNEGFTMHIINGLAYQLQTGKPVPYCVLLHGNTGTGKGIILNEILPRIFGESNVRINKANVLNEQYNGYMEHTQIVAYEEVDSAMVKSVAGTHSFLKNSITEDTITIRKMFHEPYPIERTYSMFMTSNSTAPVYIQRNDRRWNVAEFQPFKLDVDAEFIDQVRNECDEFHGYLRQFEYDAEAIRKIYHTESRERIMATAATGIDEFYHEVIEKGSFMYLLDQLPMELPMDVETHKLPYKSYASLCAKLMGIIHMREQKLAIFRDELKLLMTLCFSNIPQEPAKFTALIKHHHMYMESVRRGEMVGKGLYITFRFTEEEMITATDYYTQKLRIFANALE